MGDHHRGQIQLAMQASHPLTQGVARDRVERTERLVHQQELRLVRQRAGHTDPLALPAGQFVRHARGHGAFEIHQLEQFGDPFARQLLAADARADRDILAHAHVGKQPDRLENVADPPPQGGKRQASYRIAINQYRAGARIDQSVDRLEQGIRPRVYDRITPRLQAQYNRHPLSRIRTFDKAFPKPPGLDAWRQQMAKEAAAAKAAASQNNPSNTVDRK